MPAAFLHYEEIVSGSQLATHALTWTGGWVPEVGADPRKGRRRLFAYRARTQERPVGCPFRRRKLGISVSSSSRDSEPCGA